jgi:hypothetical protein
MAYADLSRRALAILTLERLDTMAANIQALQTAVANLQTAVAESKTVLDASQALNTRTMTVLEELVARIASLEPNEQAIADLAQSVGATVASLQSEAQEQTAASEALTAKLDSIPTTPTP